MPSAERGVKSNGSTLFVKILPGVSGGSQHDGVTPGHLLKPASRRSTCLRRRVSEVRPCPGQCGRCLPATAPPSPSGIAEPSSAIKRSWSARRGDSLASPWNDRSGASYTSARLNAICRNRIWCHPGVSSGAFLGTSLWLGAEVVAAIWISCLQLSMI
jgi:hypothetical protein